MHISLDGFVAGLNGELNWVKIDEEIFDHVGKRISQGDTALYGGGNLSNDGGLLAYRSRQTCSDQARHRTFKMVYQGGLNK